MDLWASVVSPTRRRYTVVAFGALSLVLGVGLALTELLAGRALSNIFLVALFVTVPGIVLLHGGYRLPRTDIDPKNYPTIARWCLGGFGLMFGSLARYQLEPAESISDPIRGFSSSHRSVASPGSASVAAMRSRRRTLSTSGRATRI